MHALRVRAVLIALLVTTPLLQAWTQRQGAVDAGPTYGEKLAAVFHDYFGRVKP